jgi:hypothetical protein
MPKEITDPISVKEAARRAGQKNLETRGVEYFKEISAKAHAVRAKYLEKGEEILGPGHKPNQYLQAGREFYRPDKRVKKGDGSMSVTDACRLGHEATEEKHGGTNFYARRNAAANTARLAKRKARLETTPHPD